MQAKKAKRPTVAQTIAMLVKASGKTETEIASQAGVDEKLLRAVQEGRMKLPVGKIPELAKALGHDPYDLLDQVLEEYAPEVRSAIQEVVPDWLSMYERGVVEAYRKLAAGEEIGVLISRRDSCAEIYPAKDKNEGWTIIAPAS